MLPKITLPCIALPEVCVASVLVFSKSATLDLDKQKHDGVLVVARQQLSNIVSSLCFKHVHVHHALVHHALVHHVHHGHSSCGSVAHLVIMPVSA